VTSVIPLVDLGAQYRAIREEVHAAMDAVLESSQFILGEALAEFERATADFLGVRHAIGVGTGFDALRLALEAAAIGAGAEVILPANTYVATALAVAAVGARPVLVDCRADTYAIDPELIPGAITPRTRAIIPVHLYGQSADMDAVLEVARANRLDVIEDAAQAHGARFRGRACGSMGRAGCFSFYPSKNLGAYGDGGLIATDDDDLAARARALGNYGQAVKGEHAVKGVNSRLDTLQAAVLAVKLRHLDDWNARRSACARRYDERLAGHGIGLPITDPRTRHVFHLYVVRVPRRDAVRAHLAHLGIQTGVHYPAPVHLVPAFAELGCGRGTFPVAERASREILSLPMYAELTDAQIERVARGVLEGLGQAG
jgi:dTDP-4-amino-4,6-dideoxygalactose transaminase